ncbi:MAG: TrkH family potassium uptake protein [Mogibacterium sp.]|nr:TrkH family potassium uptake protein [Mogibacterium sp.]
MTIRLNNNKKFILNIISAAFEIYGICLLPCIGVSAVMHEDIDYFPLSMVCLISLMGGFIGRRMITSSIHQVRPRICYMTTLFTWLLLIAITVIPFYYGIPGYSVVDAILESTASWTTTGIGVYDTASLPMALQLLRSICNWLGGIGIIMVTLALLSSRKFIGWNLASTEFPGPTFLKNDSPFRTDYRKLVGIYAGFTLLQFILLLLAKMPPFAALLTALSNSSTSGLQHINNGVAIALSTPVKIIITVFAFLGSVNCSLFLLGIRRKFKDVLKNSELMFYFWRVVLTSLLITVFIAVSMPERSLFSELGRVIMQVISFVSTSGYIITDCAKWPPACMLFILLQMFIGSCAMSTGGGIKVARIIIALKTVPFSVYRHIHPNSVRTLTFSKKPMKSDYVIRANLFVALFMITYLLGALLLSFDEMGLYDALNYSQAMITNTGTSIGELDAPGLAERFTPFTKLMMCLLMIAGRLEIYPLLMIFFRNFWKSDASV